MKDEPISDETAKLLVTKGFERFKVQDAVNFPGGIEHWPVVTQSLIKRWLREVHQLHIEVCVRDLVEQPEYYWNIFGKYKEMTLIRCITNSGSEKTKENYPSYEEALESAIQIALKKLDDKLPAV